MTNSFEEADDQEEMKAGKMQFYSTQNTNIIQADSRGFEIKEDEGELRWKDMFGCGDRWILIAFILTSHQGPKKDKYPFQPRSLMSGYPERPHVAQQTYDCGDGDEPVLRKPRHSRGWRYSRG